MIKIILCILLTYAAVVRPFLRGRRELSQASKDPGRMAYEDRIAALRAEFRKSFERNRRFPTAQNSDDMNHKFFVLLGAIRTSRF